MLQSETEGRLIAGYCPWEPNDKFSMLQVTETDTLSWPKSQWTIADKRLGWDSRQRKPGGNTAAHANQAAAGGSGAGADFVPFPHDKGTGEASTVLPSAPALWRGEGP